MKLRTFASVAAACVLGAAVARADDQPAPAPPAPPPLFPLPYGLKLSGHVEAGSSFNVDSPDNNINFGQLFTDRANSFRVNQAMLSLERDLDPKNAGLQWGFKLQGMYGTDSRITHFFNEFDRSTNSPYQWDITEADLQAHLPTFGGGTDLKLGQYPTPLGEEVIDSTQNLLYSKSYIFNYGLPLKHTGLLTTTHVNDTLDIWLGLDTGVNDSIGAKGMANNFAPKGIIGFGLNNLLGGNLTILALSHIGPEAPRFFEATDPVTDQPSGAIAPVPGANNKVEQFYDIVTTYKINDAWSTVNELNYVKSDFLEASAGGVAQYLTYTISDQWSITGRIEAFADQSKGAGGFVCDFTNSQGFVNGERGLAPSLSYCGSSVPYNVTYGEITLGATYKPGLPWSQINAMIRPEIRYDTVIGGSSGVKPFDVTTSSGSNFAAGTTTTPGSKSSQVTLAVDFIIGF